MPTIPWDTFLAKLGGAFGAYWVERTFFKERSHIALRNRDSIGWYNGSCDSTIFFAKDNPHITQDPVTKAYLLTYFLPEMKDSGETDNDGYPVMVPTGNILTKTATIQLLQVQ